MSPAPPLRSVQRTVRAGASEAVLRAATALRKGRVVLITDPLRPERGGVLAVAAERAHEDVMNFLLSASRGVLVCLALTHERAERLGLEALAATDPDGPLSDRYTVSVEAREGTSTGISASDRSRTVQVIAEPGTRPEDLVTPGHVFPVLADERGVLARPGWAEASLDLARISGLRPTVAYCQVIDPSGEVATGPVLRDLAEELGIPGVGLAALMAHRMATESFVTQLTHEALPTRWGDFVCRVFRDELGGEQHLVFSQGELRGGEPLLVRLHSECLTGDVLGSLRCDCGEQLAGAMAAVAEEGRGAVVYLRQEGRGIGLVAKINAYGLQDEGRDTVDANLELGFDADPRDFGVGAQILLALGVERLRLLTNNPRKLHDMEGYGIEVVAREPLEFGPTEHNVDYLRAKKERLGHLLTGV